VSASAPAMGSRLSAAPPASSLSLSAPASSSLSRATSLPALADPAARLQQREAKLTRAMKECYEFQNKGSRGKRWDKPLGQTDVTHFHDEFAKSTGGIPLHKFNVERKSGKPGGS
ncbi:unnamed protein product, partial [Polarella glacialis]